MLAACGGVWEHLFGQTSGPAGQGFQLGLEEAVFGKLGTVGAELLDM